MDDKNITLEAVQREADAVRAELDGLDDEPTVTRKIKFPVEGGNGEFKSRNFFAAKNDPATYDLETLSLGRMLLQARGSVLPDSLESRFQSLADRMRKYTLTTTGSGTGAELVDVLMWDRLFQDVISKTLVAQLFTPWLQMRAGSMELPSLGNVTFYKPSGEGEAVTATDLATAKRTITARTLKAQVDVSDEEDEDAIVNSLIEIRQILRRNAAEVIDEAILNADASTGKQNINYYAATGGSDISTSSRFLIGFDGLIHYCLNEVTGQKSDMSTLETADFATLIGLLGKYADDPSRCAFIVDRWVKNKAVQLDDFRTVDKLGAQATLLTGQIGQIYGVPVVLSSQIAKSNATGQVDQTAENNTKGRIVLVNRDMWKFGVRRSIRVATERSEAKTLTSIVVSMRIALQCYGDRSDASYCHTALGFDATV